MPRLLIASSVLLTAVVATFADTHTTGVPVLNSRPGATYTVYLDFAGFNFTGIWAFDGTPGATPAYDGAVGAFSAADQANIANIWARVAEKYAAFNINVTTVDPAVAAGRASTDAQRQAYYDSTADLMHTVIGGTGSWLGSSPGTGVSVIGADKNTFVTFNNNGAGSGDHTDWVFAGPYSSNLMLLGEVVSHENGHGLGLAHQSDFSDTTLLNEYSSNSGVTGFGSYAPVMGNSFSSQRGTWRIGTNKTDIVQNDIQIIESNPGMGNFVDDGIAHSTTSAAFLPLNGSLVSPGQAKGIIVPASSALPLAIGAGNYTKDYFSFRSDGSLLSLTVNDGGERLATGVADPSATLRSTLMILDASLNVVGTATMSVNTLSETFTGTLPAGRYYAAIASAGGYTSISDPTAIYYDIGSYFLTGSGFSAAKWVAGASGGDWSVAANWLGQVVPQSSEDVVIGTGSSVGHSAGTDTVQTLTNSGTLNITGGTIAAASYIQSSGLTTIAGGKLSGAISVQGGALAVGANGTLSANAFQVTGGLLSIAAGATASAQTMTIQPTSGGSAELLVNAPMTTSSLGLYAGGTLAGSGSFQITGAATWAGGTMGGGTASDGHTVIAAGGSLAITAGGGATLARVVDNAGAATLSGSGNWTFNGGTFNNQAGATFNVTGANTIIGGANDSFLNAGTLGKNGVGNTLIQLTLINTGTVAVHGGGISLAGALAANNGLATIASASAGSIAVDAGGTLTANDLRQASLTSAGAVMTRSFANGGGTSVIGTLTLTGAGTLDMADNRLVVEIGGAAAVRQLLLSAYDGGKWDGPGLTSSTARTDPLQNTAIGYITASQLGVTTWGGVSGLGGSEVLTRITVIGDANMDGKINADDYALLDRGMRLNLGGWVNGDFNYSGSVDAMDYWLLDRADLLQDGLQSADSMLASREAEFGEEYVSSLLASVPEPGAMGVLGACGVCLGRRRRWMASV